MQVANDTEMERRILAIGARARASGTDGLARQANGVLDDGTMVVRSSRLDEFKAAVFGGGSETAQLQGPDRTGAAPLGGAATKRERGVPQGGVAAGRDRHNLTRGGAEAARLVHAQEVAGSSPAPATSSPECGSSGAVPSLPTRPAVPEMPEPRRGTLSPFCPRRGSIPSDQSGGMVPPGNNRRAGMVTNGPKNARFYEVLKPLLPKAWSLVEAWRKAMAEYKAEMEAAGGKFDFRACPSVSAAQKYLKAHKIDYPRGRKPTNFPRAAAKGGDLARTAPARPGDRFVGRTAAAAPVGPTPQERPADPASQVLATIDGWIADLERQLAAVRLTREYLESQQLKAKG